MARRRPQRIRVSGVVRKTWNSGCHAPVIPSPAPLEFPIALRGKPPAEQRRDHKVHDGKTQSAVRDEREIGGEVRQAQCLRQRDS